MHRRPVRAKSEASYGSRVGYSQTLHYTFISTFKIIMSIFLMMKTKNKKAWSGKQLTGEVYHVV